MVRASGAMSMGNGSDKRLIILTWCIDDYVWLACCFRLMYFFCDWTTWLIGIGGGSTIFIEGVLNIKK